MSQPSRHALVTGASGGLGVAIAARLLTAGYRVTLADRSPLREDAADRLQAIGPAGVDCAANLVQIDLADACRRAALLERVGRVDVLVNNAAIYPRSEVSALTVSDLRDVLEVNLVAAVDLMTRFGAGMAATGWGRIVNITSITALGGFPGLGAYAASKAGLLGISAVAAVEYGPRAVTVNCVAPGAIATAAEPTDTDPAAVIARQSLPFRGTPEDIAAAVGYLVSDDARFVTGQTISVDGGWRLS